MTRIKICGVTGAPDAVAAADAGADAVGLNFYLQSPRFLTPAIAASIVRELPPFTATVGVFVGTKIRHATAVAFQLGLRAIQTYPDGPPDANTFPFAHVPSFRVRGAADLVAVRNYASAHRPAAVVIDSFVAGQMGGTGHVAPWDLLVGFDPGVPVVLAGGLTPENVAAAIRTVRPWAVDVASGVESAPGIKDVGKIRAFVTAVRAVDGE